MDSVTIPLVGLLVTSAATAILFLVLYASVRMIERRLDAIERRLTALRLWVDDPHNEVDLHDRLK